MGDVKHRVLADALKADILNGKYRMNRAFPSEAQVSRRFKVSRTTVRKAFDDLRGDGLIASIQGRGTFVTRRAASRKIGLVVPGVVYSEFFPSIVDEISRLASVNGYMLMLGNASDRRPELRMRQVMSFAEDCVEEGVSGVIYQPIELIENAEKANRNVLSVFAAADIPVVIIDCDFTKTPRRSGYDIVGIDNVAAGMAVAAHLLSRGVRKIHFQSRPRCSTSVRDRRNGVVAAMAPVGTAARNFRDFIAEPDDLAALKEHLRKGRPDAFVCGNDMAAVWLKESLERLGLKIPDDILLAGFDDINCATIVTPQLTTVHQPCEKIAEVAFNRLVARISDASIPPCSISLPADLVVRASTLRRND
jgi:LacI family transcriptional regulator